uniref:Uncharacterized protein n=1 Tax=Vitis vinifera TaxID=29760 RepID=A5AU56_VITVI|nr:hypothetical protein VITISV_027944 [Vitis vinifera]
MAEAAMLDCSASSALSPSLLSRLFMGLGSSAHALILILYEIGGDTWLVNDPFDLFLFSPNTLKLFLFSL